MRLRCANPTRPTPWRLCVMALVALVSFMSSADGAQETTVAHGNVRELFDSKAGCPDCHRFDGIGGISAGGGTARLLVEYPPAIQSEILDFLFKPNFGASLHMLKVEIGGDSYSTDGSETSHMHSEQDLHLNRGYEWFLLKEAKKRNPNILTYGLSWAFPGWITDASHDPFRFLDKITNYTFQWVKGAREVHGIDIDYLGVWNERASNRDYVLAMRKLLDENGFNNTKLVVNDGEPQDCCPKMMNDTEYIKATAILGFHYPYDNSGIWPNCSSIGLPIWSAEESSSYDDLNGAACWARVLASHYVLHNMTANLMWNLVGAYFHGTNWYASAMLTAVQPWSGYYEWEQMPVVWATAHYTQFIQPGWKYLPVGKGSGELAKGGYYTTLVSPDLKYFTVIVVKISREHAECTRPALWNWDTEEELLHLTIDLPETSMDMGSDDGETQTWYSNLEQEDTVLFQKLDQDNNGGLSRVSFATSTRLGVRSYDISLNVTIGGIFTVTNQMNVGNKGTTKDPRTPEARFPLPYSDDFSSYGCDNCYSKYFTDQMGAFEIQFVDDGKHRALVQMAPQVPVGWVPFQTGPWTLMGMTEWEDVSVEVSFRLPDPATYACVSTRADQYWRAGVSMCANASDWFLVYGGAPLNGFDPKAVIEHGAVSNTLRLGDWHKLGVATLGHRVEGLVNEQLVGKHNSIRVGDSGFVALGTSAYAAVQFGHIEIKGIGPSWVTPKSTPPVLDPGSTWTLALGLCTPNGLTTNSERFDVNANWQIKQLPSGLCVTVLDGDGDDDASPVELTLQKCVHDSAQQQFRNDYTQLRNQGVHSLTNAKGDLCATRDGKVTLTGESLSSSGPKTTCAGTDDGFVKWAIYPNTNQLRNAFGYDPSVGGRAQCIKAVQRRGPEQGEAEKGLLINH